MVSFEQRVFVGVVLSAPETSAGISELFFPDLDAPATFSRNATHRLEVEDVESSLGAWSSTLREAGRHLHPGL